MTGQTIYIKTGSGNILDLDAKRVAEWESVAGTAHTVACMSPKSSRPLITFQIFQPGLFHKSQKNNYISLTTIWKNCPGHGTPERLLNNWIFS